MTTTDPRARLDEIKARVDRLDRGLPCAWCGIASMGLARHNDELLHPSCGEDGHGFEWRAAVSPQTVAGALTSYPDMAAALTAVLDLPSKIAAMELSEQNQYRAVGYNEGLAAAVTAITDALGGGRG